MSRLNCFIDESGQDDMSSDLYLVTLVFHEHKDAIAPNIAAYQHHLEQSHLPDIPFHMVELLHGHDVYHDLALSTRKPLLYEFATFVRKLPIRYVTLRFSARDLKSKQDLEAKMRRDLSTFLFAHLDYFQQFDQVAIYYDGGSSVVTRAVHAAFDFVLARNVANYRVPIYAERRLLQVADYLTSIELAASRFETDTQSKTYERFYGEKSAFKRNLLKPARRLQMGKISQVTAIF